MMADERSRQLDELRTAAAVCGYWDGEKQWVQAMGCKWWLLVDDEVKAVLYDRRPTFAPSARSPLERAMVPPSIGSGPARGSK